MDVKMNPDTGVIAQRIPEHVRSQEEGRQHLTWLAWTWGDEHEGHGLQVSLISDEDVAGWLDLHPGEPRA